MCSIFGILKKKGKITVVEEMLIGLKTLEYRGYDSAGIALKMGNDFTICKTNNKDNAMEGVDVLRKIITENGQDKTKAEMAIGHTRWSTNGKISKENAHPHVSHKNNFALVHNGIIENYEELKELLLRKKYEFTSETDTEVLVHLIEEFWNESGKTSFTEAVRQALGLIEGAFAIAVISKNDDSLVVASRSGSMFVGISKDGYVVASDQSAILRHTRKVFEVEGNCMAVLTAQGHFLRSLSDNGEVEPKIEELTLELEEIQKGKYTHFMQKEIFEQPKTLTDCLRGRVRPNEGIIKLRGIEEFLPKLVKARRIIIIGCGTSWHAALVAKYLFEDFARIPVEVEYASEFAFRNPVLEEEDIVFAISQSGATKDTLDALETAKKRGATILGLCNVIGSKIARAAGVGVYLHVGPEISVASTKAFTGQVAVLTAIALLVGQRKGTISVAQYMQLIVELADLPKVVEEYLPSFDVRAKEIAEKYNYAENALYLGRGYGFPAALEGALKLKEIAYVHAEGYPAAEMKHGPIALINEKFPVFAIANYGSVYKKMKEHVQEIQARTGKVIALVTKGEKDISAIAESVIEIPDVSEHLIPIVAVIPLQLVAYHSAVLKGLDVDKPRSLAKSVTV